LKQFETGDEVLEFNMFLLATRYVWYSQNTEWLGYRVVKKLWRCVKPLRYNTGAWRTDGHADG